MSELAFAIVRPDGRIQKSLTHLEGEQLEVYSRADDAGFIRAKAYPALRVVPVRIVPAEEGAIK